MHGILQARILEWVAFPFSRGSSQPRDKDSCSSSPNIPVGKVTKGERIPEDKGSLPETLALRAANRKTKWCLLQQQGLSDRPQGLESFFEAYLVRLRTQLEQLQRERGSLDAELKSCQGQEEEYKAKYVNHSIPMGPGGSWEGLNRLSAESCPSSELPESQDRPPLWPLCIPTLSDSQGAPSAAGKRPPSP